VKETVKLNEAFQTFTQASKSLESYYGKLSERVRYLTNELERKNSQLSRALLEIRDSREYLKAILQSIGEAMIVLDRDEKITMINRASEELLCLDSRDVIGKMFNELDVEIDDERSGTKLTVKGRKYEIIFSRSVVSDPEGLVRGYVVLIKDITRLKELEQWNERNQRLISMGEMAAKIVHEIRSPLCSIELFSNMLSTDLKGTEHSEMADGISTGIRSLNNILTNMLFFAKPQKPSFTGIDIGSTVEESVKVLAPLMDVRGIRLHASTGNESVCGDSELLKQVFMNIVLNAIQAMSGGGDLKVETGTTDGYVTVSVIDDGEGITDENLEKIFDPFFSTKEKGTGLGLAIVHKIVQSHNGLIKVFRNEGAGSTFCIYFPLEDQEGRCK
jgi:PAS domain S-box-containing protein